jgi:hypothetical protein
MLGHCSTNGLQGSTTQAFPRFSCLEVIIVNTQQIRDTAQLRFLSDAKIVEWRYGRNLIPFHGLISFDEKKATLAREFDFPRLDEKFEWIIDPYSG